VISWLNGLASQVNFIIPGYFILFLGTIASTCILGVRTNQITFDVRNLRSPQRSLWTLQYSWMWHLVDWYDPLGGTRCFHLHLTGTSRAYWCWPCWNQLPQPRYVFLLSSLFWELNHMLKYKDWRWPCWDQLPQPRHVFLLSSLFWELDHMLKCKDTYAHPFHLGTSFLRRKGVSGAVKCKICYMYTQARPFFSHYAASESSPADCKPMAFLSCSTQFYNDFLHCSCEHNHITITVVVKRWPCWCSMVTNLVCSGLWTGGCVVHPSWPKILGWKLRPRNS
jgi:hypothetical protein